MVLDEPPMSFNHPHDFIDAGCRYQVVESLAALEALAEHFPFDAENKG
jgi:hypothetical protein